LLSGPLPERSTSPVLADLQLQAGEQTALHFAGEQTALVYVYSGATTELSQGQLGVYSRGEALELTAADNKSAGMLILSGRALQEPIVQYGPFVMNTRIEIEQAFQDFRQNNFV